MKFLVQKGDVVLVKGSRGVQMEGIVEALDFMRVPQPPTPSPRLRFWEKGSVKPPSLAKRRSMGGGRGRETMSMNAFVLPFLISLVVVLLFGQRTIDYLRSKKSVQPISPDAPEKHRLKHGTPTMGGLLILAAVSVALIVTATTLDTAHAPALWLILVTFLGAGAIGYLDDLGKG